MAAVAAAQMGGGKAVVKMKPGAYERTASIRALFPAMYPPMQPNALASVPSSTSIRSITPSCSATHADGVHLVRIRHGAIALREIADAMHRRQVAIHGINSLEYDQLRPILP